MSSKIKPILLSLTAAAGGAFGIGGAIDLLEGANTKFYQSWMADFILGNNHGLLLPVIAMGAVTALSLDKTKSGLSKIFDGFAIAGTALSAISIFVPPHSFEPLFVMYLGLGIAGMSNVASQLTRNMQVSLSITKTQPSPPKP